MTHPAAPSSILRTPQNISSLEPSLLPCSDHHPTLPTQTGPDSGWHQHILLVNTTECWGAGISAWCGERPPAAEMAIPTSPPPGGGQGQFSDLGVSQRSGLQLAPPHACAVDLCFSSQLCPEACQGLHSHRPCPASDCLTITHAGQLSLPHIFCVCINPY